MSGSITPYAIVWRPKARDDLLAIVRHIGKDNPMRASSFGRELRDKVGALAEHPRLGREGRPGLPKGTRELVVHANYIVFYRLRDEESTVDVQRVRHVARQLS